MGCSSSSPTTPQVTHSSKPPLSLIIGIPHSHILPVEVYPDFNRCNNSRSAYVLLTVDSPPPLPNPPPSTMDSLPDAAVILVSSYTTAMSSNQVTPALRNIFASVSDSGFILANTSSPTSTFCALSFFFILLFFAAKFSLYSSVLT